MIDLSDGAGTVTIAVGGVPFPTQRRAYCRFQRPSSGGPLFPDDTPIVGHLSAEDGTPADWTDEATSHFGHILFMRDGGELFGITKIDATGRFEAKV